MSMLAQEIKTKTDQLLDIHAVDLLVLADHHNIQYSTGIKIPCSHAQPDLIMIALIEKDAVPKVILPRCWVASAQQTKYEAELISYDVVQSPINAVEEILMNHLMEKKFIGTDANIVPLRLGKMVFEQIERSGAKMAAIEDAVAAARSLKTKTEINHIRSIALKTDHAINGYFHHLIADRSKSSMSISENLRIHSLERDIEIEGYNACSRGVIGKSIKNIWAYAPIFGFASDDFTEIGDIIIADAMNSERGYWNNATRIGIMADVMSADQEVAYDQLVRLREIMCDKVKAGRTAGDIHRDIVEAANSQNISIIKDHQFGFSVGVSAREAPFLTSGDQTVLKAGMTMVLDGIVKYKGLLYRSRDTVLITDKHPELLNWYKDWREPYFALNTI